MANMIYAKECLVNAKHNFHSYRKTQRYALHTIAMTQLEEAVKEIEEFIKEKEEE